MRSLALSILLAGSLGGCALFAPDPVEDAHAAYQAQDFFEARELAMKALERDASDAEALALLARVQVAMGAGADALLTLGRLAETGGAPEDADLLRAEALLQTGERDEAGALLAGRPEAEAHRLRALAAVQNDDPATAAREFLSGREAEGDKRKLFTAAASFHLDRGNADGARYAVGQAQRLAPAAIETLFVSARLAQLDGRHELAARAYLAILDHTPNDRPAMLGAIKELDELGRLDLIRPLVTRGRAAYPDDIAFIYLDASVHAYEGRWQAARDLLQEHEAEVQGHDDARGLYGQALLELGQVEMARAQIEPLARRYPGNRVYSELYARIRAAT
ncbi:MAG: tetratricopeptide repeat protein [Alteraurantiacibacter sp.]